MLEDKDTYYWERKSVLQISKGLYVFDCLWYILMSMLFYRRNLFRSLSGCTYIFSRNILWMLSIGSVVLGYIVTRKQHRTAFGVFVSSAIPFEIYTLLVYYKYFSTFAIVLLIISSVLSTIYLLWIWKDYTPENKKLSKGISRRISDSFFYIRNVFAVGLIPFVVFLCVVMVIRGGVIISPSTEAETDFHYQRETVSESNVIVLQLQSDEWKKLTNTEKIDVMQAIANIEHRYLGIAHEINVKAGLLEDDTLGHYNHGKYEVLINLEHLENDPVDEVLDTLLHECYHAYQWSLVELYGDTDEQYKNLRLLAKARIYLTNFMDYQDSGDDFEDYFSYLYQDVEYDARQYAADAVYDYHNMIKEYLSADQTPE